MRQWAAVGVDLHNPLSMESSAQALATMPMPSYGVGTAWETEECPFCAWRGAADARVPPEEQLHAERCPVRLARAAIGLPAPIGTFTTQHAVGIGQGPEYPNYRYYEGRCQTCGWVGSRFPKDGTQGPWQQSADEVVAHRQASLGPADGMEAGNYVYDDDDA